MESSWEIVIFLWSSIILVIAVLLIREFRKTPEQHRDEADMARKRYEEQCLSRKIVEVTPLGITDTQFKHGELGGALFGGFIGGIPGAIIGAVLPSGKGVPVESFAVRYGNGKVVIRECMQGSSEYKALMRYVRK